MEKRAVCISCYNFYEHRVELVLERLRALGYACTYITGDYSHFTRQEYHIDYPDSEQVPTLRYRRNVSPQRIRSHLKFSRDVFRRVEQLGPELVYVMVPPNSLSREAAAYKKRHPGTRLILDIYDLWPESFPSDKVKRLAALPFALWGRFRDVGLQSADIVYTECRLFAQVLGKRLAGKDVRLLPLCRERATTADPTAPAGEELGLCYLGSIGKLLDIDALTALIREAVRLRPVALHIVGEGETREQLIAAAREAGARVVHHGRLYGEAERQAIFDQCHFGINMMKDSVRVGLTMKSLDYFAGGLPILNTIAGDTRENIAAYGAGIEVDRANIAAAARRAAGMTREQNTAMRRAALRMFRENYTVEQVRHILAGLE